MDTNAETSNPESALKKNIFDELSRDELIAKCKGLLVIAQKAKQAKTELQNEVESYKLQFDKYETEKKASLESVKTLQEMLNTLTEQKLNYITEIDSARNKTQQLKTKCDRYEEETTKFKEDLSKKNNHIMELTQKMSDMDSEIISLKRQNNRLSEENEQLINQLTEFEARVSEFNDIGLQQREQLRVLEEKVQEGNTPSPLITELNNKISLLEKELETSKTSIDSKKQHELENKVLELTKSYESEKNKNEKANMKLKSYRDKILKCANCINQLKNSRFILSKTVKEYAENIPKWQNDILKASKVLEEQITNLTSENQKLKEKIVIFENQLTKATQSNFIQIQELVSENSSQKIDISNLKEQLAASEKLTIALKQDLEESKSRYHDLHENELPAKSKEIEFLRNQAKEVAQSINNLKDENSRLKQTEKELKNHIQNLNDSLQNKSKGAEEIENYTLQIKALEIEKATLVKEKLNAKDNVSELENRNKTLEEQLDRMHSKIQSLNTTVETLSQENSVMKTKHKTEKEGEINNLMCKVMTLQEQYDLLKKEHDDLQDLNGLLKEEVETLKLSLEQPRDDAELSDLNVSLQADIAKLETKLSAYKQENGSLLAEMKECRVKAKEFDALVTEYEDAKAKLTGYKTENAELLNEMKEINQVLKERGEAISKLQKAVSEMETLIDTLEKDRDNMAREKSELNKKIEILENEIKVVEQKTYKSSEATEQIVAERDNAVQALTEKESIIASLEDEIEKLRQQQSSAVDLPNDDNMSTSTISRAEDHSRMKDLDETFEDKYTKLRLFALKLKKKLNETTTQLQNSEQDKAKLEKLLHESGISYNKGRSVDQVDRNIKEVSSDEISSLQAKVQNLTETVAASESLAVEMDKLKADLEKKSQEFTAELEAHKATKDQLEKVRREVKKKSVLSLEMEDYERSMKELTSKMEESKKKMIQMESTIDTQEGTITAMKTQIKLLEEQVKAEETQNRLVKEELHQAIEEGKEKENVILVKNGIITKLERELEDEKRKNEEADFEMTSMLSEKEKVIMGLGEDKTELNNKVKKLEFKCAELNESLRITNIELADLKAEYTSYKVRAQAVLRQNQTVDHSQEEQLKEETAALKAQIETLTAKLATSQEQLSTQTAEVEAGRRRVAEASNDASRAQQRAARLQTDLTRLGQQLEAERAQHKLQVSTLTQCYKTQIHELETRLQKDTEVLKKQVMALQENAKSLKIGAGDEANHNQYMLPVIPKEDSDDGEMDINVSMIPREEGEGSESAPTPPLSKPYFSAGGGNRSPVPLERLLEEGVPDDEALDTTSLGLTPEQEISDLRRKLQAQQQKVKHVTMLLAESERESARMAQLSELLKAELRRVRGTTQQTHNTEYMKNVTLKFLTLAPGDERSRLVPVLQKILTLTPDETQKIQAIAKGLDPNPGKSWGSYLPWPGGK